METTEEKFENLESSVKMKFSFEGFEGPLDLLLELISQRNIEIKDVKLAEITDQFVHYVENMEEMKLVFENKQGFVKTMWCGDRQCEDKMKEEVGVTIRCIPLEQEDLGNKCVCCGKEANKMIYVGKQY